MSKNVKDISIPTNKKLDKFLHYNSKKLTLKYYGVIMFKTKEEIWVFLKEQIGTVA